MESPVEQGKRAGQDEGRRRREGWAEGDESRLRQLREDAARPLAVNLAEGLALSEFLSTFTGAARRT
jgi:hypothetical protein